jgi:hypothetical protein
MVPRSFALLAVLLAACQSSAQVVREGPGWREVRVSEKETRFELANPDPKAAAEIARTHPDPALRAAALDRVGDPAVLAQVASGDADAGVRRRAVGRIVDRATLASIAEKDADPAIRALAAERRDLVRWVSAKSPEHAAWASRPVGAWVRYRIDLVSGADKSSLVVVRTLAACGPAGAVVEQRDAATGKALNGRVRELLDRADAPSGRRVENVESIDLRGRRVDCPTALVSGQFGSVIARIKTWRSDEIPGGLARIDVEESPEGFPLRSLRAFAAEWGP